MSHRTFRVKRGGHFIAGPRSNKQPLITLTLAVICQRIVGVSDCGRKQPRNSTRNMKMLLFFVIISVKLASSGGLTQDQRYQTQLKIYWSCLQWWIVKGLYRFPRNKRFGLQDVCVFLLPAETDYLEGFHVRPSSQSSCCVPPSFSLIFQSKTAWNSRPWLMRPVR